MKKSLEISQAWIDWDLPNDQDGDEASGSVKIP